MRISVVIPTHNRRTLLAEALESVFAQTRPPDEIVIVDDGSTDDTRAYVTGFADRVRYVFQENRGAAAARNAGLSAATTDHVAFLDSDDFWRPTKLARQESALRAEPKFQWSICDSQPIDIAGRPLQGHHRPILGGDITEALFRHVFVHTPAVLARRDLLRDLGGFDETLRVAEDYDLWLKTSVKSKVAAVFEPLLLRRVHAQSLAHTDDPRNLDHKFRVLERFAATVDGQNRVEPKVRNARLARAAFQAARAHLRHRNLDTARNYIEHAVSYAPWNLRLRWWLYRLRRMRRPA